jgi:hypothetical protein
MPAFSLWSTQTGADVEWGTGAIPTVTLPGTTPFGDFSEYLYVDYGFLSGVDYSITLSYTKTYLAGTSNPRTIKLHVLDNSYVSQFSEVVATPASPGGSGSVTLSFTATSSCTKIAVKVADGSNVVFTLDAISGTSKDPTDLTTTQEISEPDGWMEAVLKLERHPEYRSLLEYFDGGFIFYGDNGVVNGGIDFIKALEQIYGPDVSIEILIEFSDDDYTYEDIFEGQLDLSMAEEMVDNKMKIPIIRDNFWAIFNSRKDTPVSLTASTDLDGNAVEEPVDPVHLNLVPQFIQEDLDFENIVGIDYWDTLAVGNVGAGEYIQFDWDTENTNEIKTKYNYPGGNSVELVPEMFLVEFGGSYYFDIKVCFTCKNYPSGGPEVIFTSMDTRMSVNIQVNGGSPILFTATDVTETYLGDTITWTEYTYQGTLNLNRSDLVYIYGLALLPFTRTIFEYANIVMLGNTRNSAPEIDMSGFPYSSFPFTSRIESYLNVTAQTAYIDTTSEGFLIHDAAAAILKSYGLGETNPFYSEILGSTLTNAREYDSDGCAWKYGLVKGLQLRQYSLAEKPFSISFDQWWKGANPILNLGLTYELIPGSTTDPTSVTVESLATWDDAGGLYPGAWNYGLFGYPFTSVNGNGGVEGYTRGTAATIAGQTYVFSVAIEILESGSSDPTMTFVFAILDGSDTEIATEEFTYLTAGLKIETFTMTPISNGTYFGVRVINDTPFDTKSLIVRLAEGDTAEQLLLNEEFEDSSFWTNEGAGTSWSIGSQLASLTLASGSSKALTQEFTGGSIGRYHFISEYTTTNIGGGESIDIVLNFYDSGNNLVSTKTESVTSSINNPLDWFFTSVVVVTKVEITVTITAGTNIDIELPFATLFAIVVSENIVVPDMQVIRVEEVEHFYDPIPELNISNIRQISRKYDNDKIYNKINIGYNVWKSEGANSIDDPQTQHIYSTIFQKIGQTITLWSEWIAAAIAVELARRSATERSTDYKHDESVFIIALNPDDVSPDAYMPELDENFSSIENLNNSDSRYNIRLSPARNFLRWRKWFNGCLQNATNSFFKFVRGEGNFDMVTDMISTSPDCLDESYSDMPLSEKQDIEVTDEYIHLPNYYEMTVPLEWTDYKTIRDNRKKAIGISLSDTGHVPLFIDKLEYSIMVGSAKISGWTTEYFDIAVIEDTAATQNCNTDVYPDTTEVNYRLLEDGYYRLTEAGDIRILE